MATFQTFHWEVSGHTYRVSDNSQICNTIVGHAERTVDNVPYTDANGAQQSLTMGISLKVRGV